MIHDADVRARTEGGNADAVTANIVNVRGEARRGEAETSWPA